MTDKKHLLLFTFLFFLTLLYLVLLSPEPLRVTLSPKNLKTGISSTVILSCAVQGSPHFAVSWYRNTEPVLPDQHFSIQGAHNETLFISAAQKRHSGAYQCFATRKGQTAQDFSIILLEGEDRKRLPCWYTIINVYVTRTVQGYYTALRVTVGITGCLFVLHYKFTSTNNAGVILLLHMRSLCLLKGNLFEVFLYFHKISQRGC